MFRVRGGPGQQKQAGPAGRERFDRAAPGALAEGRLFGQQFGQLLVFRPGLRRPAAELLQQVGPIVAAEHRRAERDRHRRLPCPKPSREAAATRRRPTIADRRALFRHGRQQLALGQRAQQMRRAQHGVGRQRRGLLQSFSVVSTTSNSRRSGRSIRREADRPRPPAPDRRPRPAATKCPPAAACRPAVLRWSRHGHPASRASNRATRLQGAGSGRFIIGRKGCESLFCGAQNAPQPTGECASHAAAGFGRADVKSTNPHAG